MALGDFGQNIPETFIPLGVFGGSSYGDTAALAQPTSPYNVMKMTG
jgi:hypothetical protein